MQRSIGISSWVSRAAIGITTFGSLPGCASAPVTPPTATIVVEQPPADSLTPAERLLALLTADNPRLEKVAMSLASFADRSSLHEAGRRLAAIARTIGTPAWRETERARMEIEAAEEQPSPLATQAQLEERETRALGAVLAAMFHVGVPAVVEYCFSLAEDDTAPTDRRLRALRVLDRVVEPGDAARIERRAQLAARVRPLSGSIEARTATDAVGKMRRALVACYRRALADDPALEARVRIKLHVGARGKVTSALEGDRLPPALDRCLRDAVNRITSLDEESPGMEITVPIVFSARGG